MRAVVWSQAALDDADDLIAYIAADNPVAASKVLDRIESTAERLARLATGHRGRVQGTYETSVVGLPYSLRMPSVRRPAETTKSLSCG